MSRVARAVASQTTTVAAIQVPTPSIVRASPMVSSEQEGDERREEADAAEERAGVPRHHLGDERAQDRLGDGEDHDHGHESLGIHAHLVEERVCHE